LGEGLGEPLGEDAPVVQPGEGVVPSQVEHLVGEPATVERRGPDRAERLEGDPVVLVEAPPGAGERDDEVAGGPAFDLDGHADVGLRPRGVAHRRGRVPEGAHRLDDQRPLDLVLVGPVGGVGSRLEQPHEPQLRQPVVAQQPHRDEDRGHGHEQQQERPRRLVLGEQRREVPEGVDRDEGPQAQQHGGATQHLAQRRPVLEGQRGRRDDEIEEEERRARHHDRDELQALLGGAGIDEVDDEDEQAAGQGGDADVEHAGAPGLRGGDAGDRRPDRPECERLHSRVGEHEVDQHAGLEADHHVTRPVRDDQRVPRHHHDHGHGQDAGCGHPAAVAPPQHDHGDRHREADHAHEGIEDGRQRGATQAWRRHRGPPPWRRVVLPDSTSDPEVLSRPGDRYPRTRTVDPHGP
jgi:hypothetical protein